MKTNNLKNTAKTIGKVTGKAGLAILSAIAYSMMETSYEQEQVENSVNGYSKAVDAISKSNLLSFQKQEAISMLPTNESSSFYDAVITVITSNMPSFSKIDTIENMVSKRK